MEKRVSRHSARYRPESLMRDPVLRKWIQPQHLDLVRLRETVLVKPTLRYLVLDDFFREDMIATLISHHASLHFEDDEPETNYHATAVRTDRALKIHAGSELFLRRAWHRYLAYIVAARLRRPGRTVVKYRRHPPRARGFWIHTDRDPDMPKALVVLGYFNRDWRAKHGGMLQFWRAYQAAPSAPAPHRWDDYLGKRLSFLTDQPRLTIELPTEHGKMTAVVDLLDQILPVYNRVVICNFQHDASYHSITPSNGRARDGFMQWLY